jgi:hypothetical protein
MGSVRPRVGTVGWILVVWLAVNVVLPLALVLMRVARRLVGNQALAGELAPRLFKGDVARGEDHVGLDELVVR